MQDGQYRVDGPPWVGREHRAQSGMKHLSGARQVAIWRVRELRHAGLQQSVSVVVSKPTKHQQHDRLTADGFGILAVFAASMHLLEQYFLLLGGSSK